MSNGNVINAEGNVINAEDRFVNKEKDNDNDKNPIQEARDMLSEKKVWFSNAGDGIEMGKDLNERLEKSHGKHADMYLMFIVHQFAAGEFGDTSVVENYKRMNNLVMHRRVRGCYPIDPEIEDRKDNEMWLITDDGHTRLVAMVADYSMPDFYDEGSFSECEHCEDSDDDDKSSDDDESS